MSGAPLAITLGDPAGIGPEIVAAAWAALRHTGRSFFAVGDAATLAATGCEVRRIATAADAPAAFADALPVLDLPLAAPVTPGQPTPAAAPQVIAWIERAVALALAGEAGGVVTAPIAKATLYEAGFAYPGHTEFVGALTAATAMRGTRGPVMMLTARDLRVALVTVHAPISQVPGLLTQAKIVAAGQVVAEALARDFGVTRPRLVVAGLNPHAGEGGTIGDEETRIVAPAVAALRAAGIDARGPLPADSLFHDAARQTYDAALCLYHDQALIPVKMLDFWGGVNLTLGLPIVRTSPDHGTAFDIAGKGLARPDSLIAALRLAAEIAERRAALVAA
ncbi:MAG TPA: 4-hydroxythreonine-4-phosphate dehydrogenase PdxA [Caulobacteraceae bacterium]|nr:4-hydroxythreonine-4-phosphate dehydrogenase PdxA [Caulobacteraceae bacterium]